MPAIRPWWSACLPSVAETCDWEISWSLIGRAPVLSRFARSCALWIVKLPEISESLPWIPSGLVRYEMYGTVIRALSSEAAK